MNTALLIQVFRRAVNSFLSFRRLKATERKLQALDDHVLKDIGLHRSEIGSVIRDLDRRGETGRTRRGCSAAEEPVMCRERAGLQTEATA